MAERARCEICNRDFPSGDALAMHNSSKHSSQKNTKINKSGNKAFVYFWIIFFVVVAGIIYFGLANKNVTGNIVSSNDSIQKITLSMKGNYYPNTITVKEGIPVEITLDSTVNGCYRSFNIPELGISKYSSSPTDTIKFTPNKKGTFGFRCSMGMGTGTIIVN